MAIGITKNEKEQYNEDLCTRTTWVDARVALNHIKKGRATGNRCALLSRQKQQDNFSLLGGFLHRNAGKILFVAIVVVGACCVGLKSAKLVTDLEKLWVQEGGRLENELNYVTRTLGEGAGTINQMLIHVAKDKRKNILSSSSLLTHLDILQKASSVTIDKYETTWSLHDLCFATNFPIFQSHLIDQIFDQLSPCAIITPLDCFWEGSKLLGPDYPVRIPGFGNKKWTNINPQEILDKFSNMNNARQAFPVDGFAKFLKRAGISTAYQHKPCLNPHDPECPDSAPNKSAKQSWDIGAELTGGCYGLASKFLHWPEELIVGGTEKNRTHYIVRAEALQSVVQLMGAKDLYEFWRENYKVHNMDWSQQKAQIILHAWLHKFSNTVQEESRKLNEVNNVHPYSTVALADLLRNISQPSMTRICLGFTLMGVYLCYCLIDFKSSKKSCLGLALALMLCIGGSIASALGVCTILGLQINATTTQILPFLSLALGFHHTYAIVHTVREVSDLKLPKNTKGCEVQEVMKRIGSSSLLSSVCMLCAFFSAAIIPVPALRNFCLQAGIICIFTCLVVHIVFPAVISLDFKRRLARRLDLLCCIPLPEKQSGEEAKSSSVNNISITATQEKSPKSMEECWVGTKAFNSSDPEMRNNYSESSVQWSFQYFIDTYYAPRIIKRKFKVLAILWMVVSIVASVWGILKVEDGLDITDIVPRNTPESAFLFAQEKYFGFYNMFAITKGNFDYPKKQKLLNEYHESFNRIPWIIKNDNGGLSNSWIALFRDWLLDLQNTFDLEWKLGLLNETDWDTKASENAILAYKLLVQTGHIDRPVDESLVTHNRLVKDGVINPKAFYNYLTAWASNDPISYSASQADIRPMPRAWYHDKMDKDLKIPKSSPIIFAQIPFLLNGLKDTKTITDMISLVREICSKFEDMGLPNFPNGVPFTFWEQYISLRSYLLIAAGSLLISTLLLLLVSLGNIWASIIMILFVAYFSLQIAGIIGIMSLKLSAISAVILVLGVGIGVTFNVPIMMGFLTNIGTKSHRVQATIKQNASHVVYGGISIFIAVTMLYFSEFDFIKRYFFCLLGVVVPLGLFNSLVILPIILSLVGPQAELLPMYEAGRLPLPTPPPSPMPTVIPIRHPKIRKHHSGRRSRMYPTNLQGSNLSLTTITEESNSGVSGESYRPSQEIVVEPQVIVETTTCPSSTNSSRECEPTPVHHDGHITTTVTATAKVKVEVHNGVNGISDSIPKCCMHSCRSSPSSSCTSSQSSCCSNSLKINSLRKSREEDS